MEKFLDFSSFLFFFFEKFLKNYYHTELDSGFLVYKNLKEILILPEFSRIFAKIISGNSDIFIILNETKSF